MQDVIDVTYLSAACILIILCISGSITISIIFVNVKKFRDKFWSDILKAPKFEIKTTK